jgi:cytochrome c-type biogenesis protein CcsB
MEKIIRKFFSIEMMTLGLFAFLAAIATATFIESAHGTQAARAVIYNAWWFEVLLVYLSINLIVNIFRYNLWRKEKIAVLTFHLAFLIIMLGAAITRYISFEGMMPIREGKQSNIIYSSDGYLQVLAHDNSMQYEMSKKLFLSDISNNHFSVSFHKPNNEDEHVEIQYVNFIPNAVDRLKTNVPNGKRIIEVVTPGPMGMDTNFVEHGSYFESNGFVLSYEAEDAPQGAVKIFQSPNGFQMQSPAPLRYLKMADQSSGTLPADTLVPFEMKRLYTMNGQNFVFRAYHKNAAIAKIKSDKKGTGKDVLFVSLHSGNKDTLIELAGGQGTVPDPSYFFFDGLNYKMAYAALPVQTPFYVALKDFRLEKYPGSDSPSSYLSDLTVIDKEKNVQFDKRVYMNHVMDYRGYRFFQSGYDPDELGTRLSVNQDYWGTNITYIGYLLMGIGMLLTLFSPNTRFRELSTKINAIHTKKASLGLIVFLLSGIGFTQTTDNSHTHTHQHTNNDAITIGGRKRSAQQKKFDETPISPEHIKKFESLLVQNTEGRIHPIHTMALEIMHKVYRADNYNKLSPCQVFLDMLINPEYWIDQSIILVSNPVLQQQLHLNGKYASFRQFFDPNTGVYLFKNEVEAATQKPQKKQNELDKQYIKVNERVQVLNMVFLYNFFKIIPVKAAQNNAWFTPMDKNAPYTNQDSLIPKLIYSYLGAVVDGKINGNYREADKWLGHIKDYQRKIANAICPTEGQVKAEIFYNKSNVNSNLAYTYLLFGFLLLMVFFARVFTKNTQWTNIPNKTLAVLMFIVFVIHGIALGMRWYVSGHAPWSDGYEAIVFIAWVGVLAGFYFSLKSAVTLGATAMLSFFLLFVAHLNQLDPQITNLVPVLKSYWLMIHVAIITGSYGFLGLGCILSIINLCLFIFRTKNNGKRVTLNINEVSYVSEMSITVGLFMLTIGTFLGGIWANESWGRYWGWDPKEVWALVSVLAYAIVLHLRLIPKMNTKIVFNTAAMWGYSMILFTFFGVNFFLVGLHSYANGEAEKMWPTWVLFTIFGFIVFNLIAIFRDRQYKKSVV